jgi:CRP/FNR family transcriptional regulator
MSESSTKIPCADCEIRAEPFFCGISRSARGRADSAAHAEEHPGGVVLFSEGQAPRGVYVLCAGRVKLSTSSGDARVLITDISGPGDVLGLCAVVSDSPYEASAETLDACRVKFIGREEFLRLLDENAGAWEQATRQLGRNYRTAHRQASVLGLSPRAAGKLACALLELHALTGGGAGVRGGGLRLVLTHEEMGQLIGASRETVTRLLNEFKRRKIIEVSGDALAILDRAALEALALPR